MKVIQLFIMISRFISLFLVILSNVFFPAIYTAGDFSYIPVDNSMDIIEGGGVSTSIYEFNGI